MLSYGIDYDSRSYKSYKAEMFEKKKQKVLQLLKSIGDLSLKDEDKKTLVNKIKQVVSEYKS